MRPRAPGCPVRVANLRPLEGEDDPGVDREHEREPSRTQAGQKYDLVDSAQMRTNSSPTMQHRVNRRVDRQSPDAQRAELPPAAS